MRLTYSSTVSTAEEGERNSISHDHLSSVDDIAEIAENETEENAVLIAQTEISCLNNLSIGDIPEDVSNTEYEIDS
jgi:TusA-related sulfurtransferase